MARFTFLRLAHLLFVAGFFGLVSVPLLTHNWRGETGIWQSEKRHTAPPPGLPRSWPDLLAWPKQADAYVADHFGQRTGMVATFNRTRYRIFGETPTEQAVFGLHGRLFLSSHSAAMPYSLIAAICGVGMPDASLDTAAAEMDGFLRQARSWAPESYLMVVPTAPTLYFHDLPPWLQDRCPLTNTMDRFLARLPQGELRSRLVYPLPAMQAADASGHPAIPLTHFHWMGAGPEATATAFAEGRLGLPRRIALPARDQVEPSDIAQMIPGLPSDSVVRLPDFVAAGVAYCHSPDCFPEWGNLGTTIYDLSRVRSPQAGDKKLLIISDSFGHGIAGWFAPYFGSVWHFSVSFLGRLTAEERDTFGRHIFREYHPDVVLYVFHDGSVVYWPKFAAQGLWGP